MTVPVSRQLWTMHPCRYSYPELAIKRLTQNKSAARLRRGCMLLLWAGTLCTEDVHMAHLSGIVIYPHGLPAACKSPPSWWSSVWLIATFPPGRCRNTTRLQQSSVPVIKGLGCWSRSSLNSTMAEADRIKPQVGAPSELNLLIWLRPSY